MWSELLVVASESQVVMVVVICLSTCHHISVGNWEVGSQDTTLFVSAVLVGVTTHCNIFSRLVLLQVGSSLTNGGALCLKQQLATFQWTTAM